MRHIKTTVFSLMLVLLAAPLWAGVEPFFKGDWGMSPDTIKKLYDTQPKEEYYSRMALMYELVYEQDLYGQPVLVTYVFNNEDELIAAGIHHYLMRDMSAHVLWEFMDDVNDTVTAALVPPVQYVTSLTDSPGNHYYDNAWLNADTFAHLYIRIEPGENLADYHCSFKFYQNDGSFDAEFERIRAAGSRPAGN